MKHLKKHFLLLILFSFFHFTSSAQQKGTLLLEQPNMSKTHITFVHGGDIWITPIGEKQALRITSTVAVESDPHISPDGKLIAFTSNRTGDASVYVVSIEGGNPTRLTYHPSAAFVRGWSNDGSYIYYASSRDTAPARYHRLWKVTKDGGPELQLTSQWATDANYSPDGKSMVIDRVRRWDKEWRAYRGGQNTPLSILNMKNMNEVLLPNNKSTDIYPIWLKDKIYFLSDRDLTMNIWCYSTTSSTLKQITTFKGADIKSLTGKENQLIYERNGALHLFDLNTKKSQQLHIKVNGDFPWAQKKWKDVSKSARSVSLSPSGKRVIMQSRGEIFTVPAEYGDSRNITNTSDAADRKPIWSPLGDKIAWFTDNNKKEYVLRVTSQDGMSKIKDYSIGESKLGWEPIWSPDGKYIAFNDDDVRIRLLNLETEKIATIDIGGINLERGNLGLTWSPDSKWLAYSKTSPNNFKRIYVWSLESNKTQAITNELAHSISPTWDLDGKHMYFISSTDLALRSGWANTSSMMANPKFTCYVVNLRNNDPSPFELRSDEEKEKKDKKDKDNKKSEGKDKKTDKDSAKKTIVKIDFDNIEQRTIALPMPTRNYRYVTSGAKGSVFISERLPNTLANTIHKFTLKDRKSKVFLEKANQFSVSANGKKAIAKTGPSWKIFNTSAAKGKGKAVQVKLKMHLDVQAEWKQIFEEAWRYQRDYFYDPNMHGRNWQKVYKRYAPLLPHVKHRSSLNYILDQMNGELSVGHSFVSGGDYPETEKYPTGLLGADFVSEKGHWKIDRIYTTETWNPNLSSPLSKPGMKAQTGNYIVGINGKEIKAKDNIFKALQGTRGVQTVIHINTSPEFKGAWTETVKPLRNENALRQRAWIEDNKRKVDKLSNGKLAYVWVPNTGGSGVNYFNRYLFAQQDKLGAVIDERFNGGGLLDDYMVDLLTRKLRAAITNEVPNGKAFKLPAGIHGPKVLLINELAGSGGDYFPWIFRHQNAGKLIGQTTWGGLVKSSTHYSFIDGGRMTAPDNAVFDPIKKEWIGENKGIAPDISIRQDAKSISEGKDPQLERAVEELLKQLKSTKEIDMIPPTFSKPAKQK
ncbi:protease [Flavivirga aquatica]|uniref:Tricorn protease homolog n=1 Tax=Flavivirga aquatica TaxID=1849968 RepID=A0A1E5SIJ1_9FLAO|nr:S41 family peptidase [Flavivirga aquatica]OEJ98931.1 protease [Flavivirga aquatica]